MSEKPSVLFVCVHNAGRSQLAAGLATHHAGAAVQVMSAGTDPDTQVDAVALASLAELGIDRYDQIPTLLTDDLLAQADVVVTLKPVLDLPHRPGVRYENWPLPDPQGWDLEGIRPLRDHLDSRVTQLLTDLHGEAPHLSCPQRTTPAPPATAGTGPAALNDEEIR